jgi:hypothetical protein
MPTSLSALGGSAAIVPVGGPVAAAPGLDDIPRHGSTTVDTLELAQI